MEIGVLKKPDNKKYPFVQKKDEYDDVIKNIYRKQMNREGSY